MAATTFPFLFLEGSPALDAINGYGKTKSNAFTTPNLKGLLVLEQKKKEESRRRRNRGDGGGHGSVMYGWVWEGKWFEFEW